MVQLRIINDIGSNRVGYERRGGTRFIDVTEHIPADATTEERLLGVVNAILANYRTKAFDATNGAVSYMGAALLRTKRGRWFVMPNLALHDDELQRSCAEAAAVGNALEHEVKKLEVKELWFMGGTRDVGTGEELDTEQHTINQKTYRLGKHATPCGNCRDIIYKFGTPNTLVHMLPLNNGHVPLIPGDPSDQREPDQLPPNQVFSRKISDLLPHLSYLLHDTDGTRKAMMKGGYTLLKKSTELQAIGDALCQQQLAELKKMEQQHCSADERMRMINRLLMEKAHDYYQSAKCKPHVLTIAIVRDKEGNYFIGKHAKNHKTAANTIAELKAIDAAISASLDNKITDVFIVHVDNEYVQTLEKDSPIAIPMPKGATLERIKKHGAGNGCAIDIRDFFGKPMSAEAGANVHVFLPNDPQESLFHPQKHVISMTVKELLPHGYQTPRQHVITRH